MSHDRPDWQIITLAIRRHYKPLAQVAREINSEEKHLNRLARGDVKDTKYKTGRRLLKLYGDICKKLNKQPEWTEPEDEAVKQQPLRRRQALQVPSELIYGTTPSKSLPELARKFLNRSNA
jgi:hypothetical protein